MFSLRRWAGVIAVALLVLGLAVPTALAISRLSWGPSGRMSGFWMMRMSSVEPAARNWIPGWMPSRRTASTPVITVRRWIMAIALTPSESNW